MDKREKRKRFKKLGTYRTEEILRRLKILSNCANRSYYYYTEDDINKIFSVIEKQVKIVKMKFKHPRTKFKL